MRGHHKNVRKSRKEATAKKLSKLKEDQEAGRVSRVRGQMAGQKNIDYLNSFD